MVRGEEPMNQEDAISEARRGLDACGIRIDHQMKAVLEQLWTRGYDYGCYVNY